MDEIVDRFWQQIQQARHRLAVIAGWQVGERAGHSSFISGGSAMQVDCFKALLIEFFRNP